MAEILMVSFMPIPLPTSPFKWEEDNDFPPPQEEEYNHFPPPQGEG